MKLVSAAPKYITWGTGETALGSGSGKQGLPCRGKEYDKFRRVPTLRSRLKTPDMQQDTTDPQVP